MFAICRKRDSKYLDFPLTTTTIHKFGLRIKVAATITPVDSES